MGLLDNVISSVTGQPSGGTNNPTSPLVKALLLLLAAKAFTSYAGAGRTAGSAQEAAPAGGQSPEAAGEITSGMLRGLPGLGAIVDRFTQNGFGNTVQSWIGTGQNQPIAPNDLHTALGPDVLDSLQQQTGLPRDQLLGQLAQVLPQVVDRLTPQGRIPTEQETAQ